MNDNDEYFEQKAVDSINETTFDDKVTIYYTVGKIPDCI